MLNWFIRTFASLKILLPAVIGFFNEIFYPELEAFVGFFEFLTVVKENARLITWSVFEFP